jgi:hypothetical protein
LPSLKYPLRCPGWWALNGGVTDQLQVPSRVIFRLFGWRCAIAEQLHTLGLLSRIVQSARGH